MDCIYNLLKLQLLVILCLTIHSPFSCSSPSIGFYAASCPLAETKVKNTVRSASDSDPTLPGKLLRLLFHDCFVEGCDASLLIQGNGIERSDPANRSLGGFEVIDSAKRLLELFCPQTVSYADILALAARDAVEYTGGPRVEIPTGRRDGRISAAANVRANIIDTSFTLDEMVKFFSDKGLSVDVLVILSACRSSHYWEITLQLLQRPVQARLKRKPHVDRFISIPAVRDAANKNVSGCS